jgi:hypothetical protein
MFHVLIKFKKREAGIVRATCDGGCGCGGKNKVSSWETAVT